MVFLHYFILEMGSFPMSVVNNFCDQPLPKYLDSKTVLIYCPHPVCTERTVNHIENRGKHKLRREFKSENWVS